MWQSCSLRISTKILVYKTVVIPTLLLYGADTWVLYRRQIRLLERFHQRCLLFILDIKWQDCESYEEVVKRASLPSIESILQLHWSGHVARMEDIHMPKAVFLCELKERKARSWCSKKTLQRPTEVTACTGGNQPSVIAAEGLSPRQLALVGEKSQSEVRGRET